MQDAVMIRIDAISISISLFPSHELRLITAGVVLSYAAGQVVRKRRVSECVCCFNRRLVTAAVLLCLGSGTFGWYSTGNTSLHRALCRP